jgi:hypothetical protein
MTSIRRFPSLLAAVLALAACGGQNAVPGGTTVPPPIPARRHAASKPSVSPKALDFKTTPTLKLKVSEAKYTGPFALSVSPAGMVKLKPTKAKGPSATISVTALNAGTGTLTIKDNHGGTAVVKVTVTQGVIIIQ